MKRAVAILTVAFLAGLGGGCTTIYPTNAVNTNSLESLDFSRVQTMKRGESCARTILGFISDGSASIADAARAAGIRTVELVEYRHTLNPLFAKQCTIVYGR